MLQPRNMPQLMYLLLDNQLFRVQSMRGEHSCCTGMCKPEDEIHARYVTYISSLTIHKETPSRFDVTATRCARSLEALVVLFPRAGECRFHPLCGLMQYPDGLEFINVLRRLLNWCYRSCTLSQYRAESRGFSCAVSGLLPPRFATMTDPHNRLGCILCSKIGVRKAGVSSATARGNGTVKDSVAREKVQMTEWMI